MERRHTAPDDDAVTLRVPRPLVALVAALLVHAIATVCFQLLPVQPKVVHPIQIALVKVPPPPPPTAMSPKPPPPPSHRAHPPVHQQPPAAPPPTTSPVVPELPPSEHPPENRAQLPIAEKSPEPAPPATWKDRLLAQLASTRPRAPQMPTGPLAPSYAALDRVAASDARLHDDETEQRIMQDFGPFFRRGLEALRGNWHPDDVLNQTERDPTRRCGTRTRTTFAVAVLDKSGSVVDVELKNASGCPELDDEAIAAFKRVAQFPHPPEGLFVGPDGTPHETARYPVRFIVTFNQGGAFSLDWR